jgi:hypothetical protein
MLSCMTKFTQNLNSCRYQSCNRWVFFLIGTGGNWSDRIGPADIPASAILRFSDSITGKSTPQLLISVFEIEQ